MFADIISIFLVYREDTKTLQEVVANIFHNVYKMHNVLDYDII